MFKLKTNDLFSCKVKVFTPSSSKPDRFDEGIFVAQFKRMSEDELKNFDDESDSSLLDHVFVGFEGVVDDEGNELPCNDETLAALKNDSCASAALIKTYVDKVKGRNLRRKN